MRKKSMWKTLGTWINGVFFNFAFEQKADKELQKRVIKAYDGCAMNDIVIKYLKTLNQKELTRFAEILGIKDAE